MNITNSGINPSDPNAGINLKTVLNQVTQTSQTSPESALQIWGKMVIPSINSQSIPRLAIIDIDMIQVNERDYKSLKDMLSKILSERWEEIVDFTDYWTDRGSTLLEPISRITNMPRINFTSEIMRGINVLTALPLSIYNTWSLAKNWQSLAPQKRVEAGAKVLSSDVGSAFSISTILEVSPHLSKIARAGASKAVTVLNPLSYGACTLMYTVSGVVSTLKARRQGRQMQAANSIAEKVTPEFSKTLFNREVARFSSLRRFTILDGAQSYILAIAYGSIGVLAALVAGGVLAAAMASPLGWAFIGTLAAGTVLAIGVVAYRRWQASSNQEPDNKLVQAVLKQPGSLDLKDLSKLFSRRESLDLTKVEDQQVLSDLLNRRVWEEAKSLETSDLTRSLLKKLKIKLTRQEMKDVNFALQVNPGESLDSMDRKERLKSQIETIIRNKLALVKKDSIHHPEVLESFNKTWHRIFNQLAKREIRDQVEKYVREVVTSNIQAEVLSQPDLRKDFKTILKLKEDASITDELVDHYIGKIIKQASWPSNPDLVQQVVHQLYGNFLETSTQP